MILTFLSGKGGVGKTSIVANLGAALARAGFRTLLIDADFFTRGLTFLMTKSVFHFDFSFAELLLESSFKAEPVFFPLSEISTNLYLLPPTRRSFEPTLEDEIRKSLYGKLQYIKARLKKEFEDFNFVLIDARSGTDYLTIIPALIADKYWIVTEEDATSQDISNLLMDIVKQAAQTEGAAASFDGFIVNKCITPRLKELTKFLERSVFAQPCISLISLSRNVRKAFIREELVVDASPGDVFSKEIRAIAKKLTGEAVSPAYERMIRYNRSERMHTLYPVIAAGVSGLVACSIWLYYYLLGDEFELTLVATLMITIIVIILFPMLYLYSRGKW